MTSHIPDPTGVAARMIAMCQKATCVSFGT